MSLSTSRQQFLAYESHNPEEIHYGKKGGIFISTCICVILVILALVFAAIIGIIVFYITYFKLSQKHEENFWDEKEMFAQPSQPSAELRLPPHVVPSFYRLKIRANLDNSSFNGEVYITISASKRVKEIILHSKDLSINSDAKLTEQIYEKVETLHLRDKRDATIDSNITQSENNSAEVAKVEVTTENIVSTNDTEANNITEITTESPVPIAEDNKTETTKSSIETFPVITEVSHSNVRNVKIIGIKESSGDRLIVTLATALRTDVDYILQLSFKGNISNSLTGFYKSSYTSSNNEVKNLGVTQFEPTSARAAFPCFDEPAFKAKFEISIAHPQNLTVLSNMNVAMQENIVDEPDWQWTHFERSVNMSTYLVAYTLSDFKSIETSYVSKNNVTKPIRIWTRPEYLSKAKYAATITPKLLSFYEEVFGLPYALDKLDLIAIPDFSSGAMENWGLITFRETTLLFDETEGIPRDKQNVAIDVAHELAHQWFGNLVTMRWWTDLWLNEGFATYIEYVGVNHIEPEWNMLESFSRDKMELLRTDALKNTSPVSRQVVDASEISQKFDEISYSKASNLIRMLNHTISKELLYKGLAIYLQDWKYRNAEENDLWAAMSKATQEVAQFKDLSVVDFMNTWTRQPGYPVVNVKRDYMSGDVTFEQRLFTSGNEMHQATADRLWHIPISYTNIEGSWSNQDTKPKLFLKDRSLVTHIDINSTQPLYVNVDAIGYYRVNYDQNNWELLSKALKSGQIKSPIAKAQLIDDAFNLAKTSLLNYSYALGLTSCVVNGEDSKIVWDLLLNNMGFLKYNLRATSSYMYFQDYMQTLLAEQLKRVNYGLDKPKDDNEAFLIENLVMWECFMEAPRCLRWARQQYDSWIAQPDLNNNTIPSYLRSLVYNIVIKHGGRPEFEMFWNLFHNTTDPNVKSLLITSLPSTRDESLITWLLEKSLSEIPKQYAVAAWSVEPPLGTAVAQRFLASRFDDVHRKFTDIDSFMFPSIVANVFGFISTDEELDKLKSFALEHKEKLQPMSQTIQKLMDTATMRIGWCKKHLPFIVNWFKEHSTGNSTSKTSSAPPVTLETNDQQISTTNLTTSAPQVTSEVNNSTEKT